MEFSTPPPDGFESDVPQAQSKPPDGYITDPLPSSVSNPMAAFKQALMNHPARTQQTPLSVSANAAAEAMPVPGIKMLLHAAFPPETRQDPNAAFAQDATTGNAQDTTLHDALVTQGIYSAPSALRGLANISNTVEGLSKAGQVMGSIEKAAGVLDRTPLLRPTATNLGQALEDLESQLKAGTLQTPQDAKDALNLLKDIRTNPKLYGASKVATAQVNRLWPQAQSLVTQLVDQQNTANMLSGAGGFVPSRAPAVADTARYFSLLQPIKTVGQILGYPVAHPVQTAGVATTAAALKYLLGLAGK